MGVLTTGQTFSSGDQVTSTKLNDIANQATFTSAADTTDNSTLTLSGGKLKVKDNGIGSTQLASDASVDANRAIETNHIKDAQVTSAKLATSAITALMPAGLILPYAGSSAPTGYLVCDGSAQSRTTYATLFGIVGTTYGTGDGSTTFNVPDLRGRVIAGQDDMGGSSANRLTGLTGGVDGDVLGGTGGDEKHALTEAQMPKHYHQMRGPNAVTAPQNDGGTTGHGIYGGGTPDDAAQEYGTYSTGGSASSGSQSTGTSNGNDHNNVQPTIILNYIIKT